MPRIPYMILDIEKTAFFNLILYSIHTKCVCVYTVWYGTQNKAANDDDKYYSLLLRIS